MNLVPYQNRGILFARRGGTQLHVVVLAPAVQQSVSAALVGIDTQGKDVTVACGDAHDLADVFRIIALLRAVAQAHTDGPLPNGNAVAGGSVAYLAQGIIAPGEYAAVRHQGIRGRAAYRHHDHIGHNGQVAGRVALHYRYRIRYVAVIFQNAQLMIAVIAPGIEMAILTQRHRIVSIGGDRNDLICAKCALVVCKLVCAQRHSSGADARKILYQPRRRLFLGSAAVAQLAIGVAAPAPHSALGIQS